MKIITGTLKVVDVNTGKALTYLNALRNTEKGQKIERKFWETIKEVCERRIQK
jgi:predicted DNA-binding ribbon-helix-helix protein